MKKLLSLFIALAAVVSVASAQQTDGSYRRSSLCLMLIDEKDMPNKEAIIGSFLIAPVPDKYNDHNIPERLVVASAYNITDADRAAFSEAVAASAPANSATVTTSAPKKPGIGGLAKGLAGGALGVATGGGQSALVDDKSKDEYAVLAYKHLIEQQVAKQLFDKWFIEDGDFSMNLIQSRGMYGASLMDVQTAKNSVRGMGMLADAGEELINNTFVVVSRFRYMSKEELVKEMEATAQSTAGAVGGKAGALISAGASVGSMGAEAALGAGYYVRTISFLFQLNWNQDISNTFYTKLWGDMDAYNAADIFSVKYVGMESAFAGVKANVFTKKSQEELISIATINATDAVLAKLEKKYDVFKTKTPLLSVNPLTAAIGMKEGVEAGDKYEVLEKSIDPETNKTIYKRVAVIKAVEGKICDNRYMAAEELAAAGAAQGVTVTTFEGGSANLYPGMLLRQIK